MIACTHVRRAALLLIAAGSMASATPADPFAAAVTASTEVQQRLAADSVEGVQDLAVTIATAAAALGDAAEPVRGAASELAAASDLRAARAAFGGLTRAILAYAGDSGVRLAPDVRIAYCPMARKYWLQKGDEIRNPYYGAAMLDCGRLVAAIPTFK